MRVKTYQLLTECVERGAQGGVERAHKHNNSPSQEEIVEAVRWNIMMEIEGYFSFYDENKE